MGMRLNFARSLDFVGAVTDGGNPKIFLDGGPTIDELILVTNVAADEFTLVIEVDGEKRVQVTGTQLADRHAYDGRGATSGYYHLSFSDVLARTLQGEVMSGLTTQPGQRVLISLELAATVTEASPTATLYAELSPNRPEEFKLFVLPEIIPITQTGENQFSGFRRGTAPQRVYIRRIFHYGAITHFSLEQDRRSVYGKRELPKAVNDARLKANGKTVPTSSTCFVFDPILKGSIVTDMFDTFSIEALRATYTMSAATDITALTEYLHDLRPRAAA